MFIHFQFFFSSRRRHTIWPRDWSSDVCSSDLDGLLPPDIVGQAEIAWTHIVTMLDQAGMAVQDLVKVTHYLTRASDIPAYVKVRARFLGDARPAAMLLIVPELVRPEFLLEIEAYAAKS